MTEQEIKEQNRRIYKRIMNEEYRIPEFIVNRAMKRMTKKIIKVDEKVLKHTKVLRANAVIKFKEKRDKGELDKALQSELNFYTRTIKYYEADIYILKNMLDEYKCYFWQNTHLLATIFGMERQSYEMVDWRTLPVR